MATELTEQRDSSDHVDPHNGKQERLANGLAWFSIGLGLAKVVAPRRVTGLIGVEDNDRARNLLRFCGMRELASGIGILAGGPRPAGWMWGRVAGDMMDLATLASAMRSSQNDRGKVAATTAAVLGVTALDILCAQQLSGSEEHNGKTMNQPVHVVRTTTINRSVEEVYRFWRDFEHFPSFMKHLESVDVTGEGRSHWTAKSPTGGTIEWDAEITEDVPNSRISWRSLEGSGIENSGSVNFYRATGGRGTVVRVDVEYAPPAGKLGAMLAKFTGEEPGQQIDADLRLLKQIIELGEIVHSDASIHHGMHAAQPSEQRNLVRRYGNESELLAWQARPPRGAGPRSEDTQPKRRNYKGDVNGNLRFGPSPI